MNDVDVDGRLEAICGASRLLEVLELQDGDWHVEKLVDAFGYGMTSAAVGDLDGDGTNEIVTTRGYGSYQGMIYVHSGVTKEVLRNGPNSWDFRIDQLVDIDGDGVLEIVVSNPYNVVIIVDSINLQRQLWAYSSYGYRTDGNRVFFEDIDHDGVLEMVAAKDTWNPDVQDYTGHTISIFDGATYDLEWEDTNLTGRVKALTLGDLDQDGTVEIVTVTQPLGGGATYLNVYDGTTRVLIRTEDVSQHSAGSRRITVADVDDDGQGELINWWSGSLQVYDGVTLALEWASDGTASYGARFEIDDVDADGSTEIVNVGGGRLRVLDGATKAVKVSADCAVYSLANLDSDLQLEGISDLGTIIDLKTGLQERIRHPHADHCRVGDLNGDGEREIVFSQVHEDGVDFHVLDAESRREQATICITNTASPVYLFLGDTDGDGSDEIFTGNDGVDCIVDGTSAEVLWQGETGWRPVRLLDIDHDGHLELVDDTYVYDFETRSVEWALPGSGEIADVVDLDGDGTIEIVRGSQNTSWRRDGNIYVIDALSHQVEWCMTNISAGVEGIATGDVDEDGVCELLYGTYGGRIHVLDGVTKAVQSEFDDTSYMHGLAVGDVDGDGHCEILCSDGWDAWNRLFVFDGTTHESKGWCSTSMGTEAHEIEIVDVDSDGVDEILVATREFFHILGRHKDPPLAITSVSPGAENGVALRWGSRAGETYSILRTSDLRTGFTPLVSAIAATPPVNTFNDTEAVGRGPYFYKLTARRGTD